MRQVRACKVHARGRWYLRGMHARGCEHTRGMHARGCEHARGMLGACMQNGLRAHLSFGRLDLLHGVGMKVGCSRHARHDGGGFGGGIDAALALAAASIATLDAAHVADAYRREDLIEGGVLCSLDLRRWRRDCARVVLSVLCSSTAIRGHQRPSEAIRGLQRPIRGHQWSGAHLLLQLEPHSSHPLLRAFV
jgi:hypothetical protein